MKATKAYIASLGTTGVLLAASILMLAVVSAVVAFDRWPGANVQAPLQTLVLTDKAPPIRVSATSTAPSATRASRTARALSTGSARIRPNSVGERLSTGLRSPVTTTAPDRPAATAPESPIKPPVEVADPPPIFDTISNPGTTAGQVADGAQRITEDAGVSVGRVSPDVGNTVVVTGQQVSQTIREIPLPDNVIPRG
jgi:hypothetical protein